MVYFTGDIHGNPAQVIKFAERMRLTNKDRKGEKNARM